MKPTRIGDTWARFDDGTCWPLPENDDGEVQWRLRYSHRDTSSTDRLTAASFMGAYADLIALPQRERNKRVAAIRKAMEMRDAKEPSR